MVLVKAAAKSVDPDNETYAEEDHYTTKLSLKSPDDIFLHRSVPDHECSKVSCMVMLSNDEGYYVSETYEYLNYLRFGKPQGQN